MSKKLCQTILITNDDGVHAEGIQHLWSIAQTLADTVYLVAPERDSSGQAQSLSLHTPLRINAHGNKQFSVNGTPADCVLLGMREIARQPVDLVLSGINRGANVGDAVGFSGTLGAAKVAAQFGVPAFGFSQAFKHADRIHWPTSVAYTAALVSYLFRIPWAKAPCVNVNFPSIPVASVAGASWCNGSEGSIQNVHVDARQDPRLRQYYWLNFEHNYRNIKTPCADISTLREHKIAVQSLNQANPFEAGTEIVLDKSSVKKEAAS
ncbi:MAG: 5'/3'-nucleotidase SurE [Pseudomonadota bacterium]|nr:5'/3'-nucleotidase SurE [Pseudomonadota bacterium]